VVEFMESKRQKTSKGDCGLHREGEARSAGCAEQQLPMISHEKNTKEEGILIGFLRKRTYAWP